MSKFYLLTKKQLNYFFSILILTTSLYSVRAQNLVPNPSFEFVYYNGCNYITDTSFQDINQVPCWGYAGCGWPSVVANFFAGGCGGGQINHFSRTGTHRASILTGEFYLCNVSDSSLAHHRSFLQTQLKQPLIAGQHYTFTMYVSGGSLNSCQNYITTTRNLGVSISTARPTASSGSIYLTPQINFNGISFITTVNNWIPLTATYIASGGEQYLTIGNFDSYINTVFEQPNLYSICNPASTTLTGWAEVTIDDVSLVPLGVIDTTASYLNIGADTIICGSSPINLTLTAQTGFSNYLWNTGDTTNSITATSAGTYYCTVNTSCSLYTDSITITSVFNNSMNFTLGNDTSVCANVPINIHLQAPVVFNSFQWNTGDTTSSINATHTGTFWVKAILGCVEVSDTIVISSILSNYNLTLGNDTTICNSGSFSFTLAPTPGFSNYLWSTGETTPVIHINSVGTYWVQADSTCGSVSDTIQINSQSYLSLNLGSDTSKCFDGVPIFLTANSGFSSYLWNTGANTQQIAASISGTYYVNATYYCGTLSDSIQVTIFPIPSPPNTNDTTICLLSTPSLLIAVGQNILWYTSSLSIVGNTTPPIPNTSAIGELLFYATQTVNGCTSNKSIQSVKVIAKPNLELSESHVICANQQISIGPTNNNWNYLWNDGTTISPRLVSTANYFVLTASNQCGNAVDSVEVRIDDCECYVYVQNAFTPNGDGLNDVFMPSVDCNLNTYELNIFNRWGELIFKTVNPKEAWDGTYKGQLCPQDVYVVQITYQGNHGINKLIMSKVLLIK